MKRNCAKGGVVFTEPGSIKDIGGYGKRREEFVQAELERLEIKKRDYEKELKELTQLYYLKIEDKELGYLNLDLTDETWVVGSKLQRNGFLARFTKEEIMDINEALWAIAVSVEDDDECDA